MSRLDPLTREQAFAYQFEDDVKLLRSISLTSRDNKTAFEKQLAVLQAHIDAYNNKKLQKACKDAEANHEITKKRMADLGFDVALALKASKK